MLADSCIVHPKLQVSAVQMRLHGPSYLNSSARASLVVVLCSVLSPLSAGALHVGISKSERL